MFVIKEGAIMSLQSSLLSTQRCVKKDIEKNVKNCGTGKLNFSSIFAEGKLQNLTIVSAFTDIEFIKKAKRRFKRNQDGRGKKGCSGQFSIYLDASASRYFSSPDIKKSLDSIAKDIENSFNENSGIFLVNCAALFHSKFIISESTTHKKITLGSINFTNRAFEQNEEIALSFYWKKKEGSHRNEEDLKNNLEKYVSSLKCEKIPSNKQTNETFSVRSQLIKGFLYYELKEQNPLRFPLGLPDDYLKHLNKKRNNGNDIPLDVKTSNAITLEGLLDELEIKTSFFDDEKTTRRNWRSYAMETCFGYWVPYGYKDAVEKDLSTVKKTKEKKLEELFNDVSNQKKYILNRFSDKLTWIINNRKEYRRENQRESKEWLLDNCTSTFNIGEKWLNGILERINKETKKYKDFRERLCKGVDSTHVPDVWNDDFVSAEDFEKSLIESIRYYLSTKNKQMKKVCYTIDKILKKNYLHNYEQLNDNQIKNAFCEAKFVE